MPIVMRIDGEKSPIESLGPNATSSATHLTWAALKRTRASSMRRRKLNTGAVTRLQPCVNNTSVFV
jgi:hypothetical protein